MPNTHITLTSLFSDIADAIRAKTGGTADIVADEFPDEIAAIPTGGGGVTHTTVTFPSAATEAGDVGAMLAALLPNSFKFALVADKNFPNDTTSDHFGYGTIYGKNPAGTNVHGTWARYRSGWQSYTTNAELMWTNTYNLSVPAGAEYDVWIVE